MDPYDEFTSGYVGMGNDPVNMVDPSGGCLTCLTELPGVTVIASRTSNVLSTISTIGSSLSVLNATVNIMNMSYQGQLLGSNINGFTTQRVGYSSYGVSTIGEPDYKMMEGVTVKSAPKKKSWFKRNFKKIVNFVHTSLDVVGATEIPIISQLADLGSGVMSLGKGDYTGALMSFGGAFVPGLSQAKLLRTGVRFAKGGRNIIHHIASNKHLSKYTPKFESIANKYGLKLDAAWNKVDISDVYHYSKHPNQYHDFVLDGMMRADMGAAGNQAKFLQLFDQYVKQPLLQNPNMLNKTGW
jgi:hypothetical protein